MVKEIIFSFIVGIWFIECVRKLLNNLTQKIKKLELKEQFDILANVLILSLLYSIFMLFIGSMKYYGGIVTSQILIVSFFIATFYLLYKIIKIDNEILKKEKRGEKK